MSWETKHRHIAYQRTQDTMHAWEMLGDEGRRELLALWRVQKAKEKRAKDSD